MNTTHIPEHRTRRPLAQFSAATFALLVLASQAWSIQAPDEEQATSSPAQAAAALVEQKPDAAQIQAAQSLTQAEPNSSINWDPAVGTPSHVSAAALGVQTLSPTKNALAKSISKGTYAERALAVMDNIAPLYRLKSAASDFQAPKSEEKDKLGFRHQKLDQVYRGIQVVGGKITVHFGASGAPYRVDGRYVPDISIGIDPVLTPQQAVDFAKSDFAQRGFSGASVIVTEEPKLVVYSPGTKPALAYQMALRFDPAHAWRYWIDACTGDVLGSVSTVCHIAPPTSGGGSLSLLSGNLLAGEGGGVKSFNGWSQNAVFYMYSPSSYYFVYNNANGDGDPPSAPSIAADRPSSPSVFAAATYPDADTYAYRGTQAWGSSDPTEVSIAVNMQATFDYFSSVQGRSGYDDFGTVVAAVAHYDLDYANAFWDGSAMFFGDGDGVTANSLAVADICAHELTHAVTEYSASLIYESEPGALNESFSDIFGALVEFNSQADESTDYPSASPGKADWLFGEDSWLEGTALRDFRNPSSTVTLAQGYQQPSKYKGNYWQDTSDPSWFNDWGGVHQNSGVQNFFFYLLSEGGSGNNGGISYDFSGIGIENAGQVAYRTLTVYCSTDTDYKNVQNAWVTAAEDLDPSWVPAVKAAWRAVGIGITSPLRVKERAGFPITPYQIKATDSPSAYSASNLPAGLSLSGNVISGTPTTIGEYDAMLSATTGGVTFEDTLHFSIADPTAPVVTIASPVVGAKFPPGRPIKCVVSATDLTDSFGPGTITEAKLYSNDVLVGTDSTAPYEFSFTPASLGACKLRATATDTDGKTGASDPVSITIGYLLPGELSYTFNPPSADNFIQALAADETGRLYLGGKFTNLVGTVSSNQLPGTNYSPRVARLLEDGTIDSAFSVNIGTGPDTNVRTMAYSLQDKGVYVAGDFSKVNGVDQPAVARLAVNTAGLPDGALDTKFDPKLASSSSKPFVRALAIQSDGKILIGGSFATVNGVSQPNLARLLPNGDLDSSFAPSLSTGGVNAIALQPDGKILIGGSFGSVGGVSRSRLARLKADGYLDLSFDVGSGPDGGFDGAVNSIAVTIDGDIVVGGQFTRYNGRPFYNNLAKLSSTGTISPKFNFTPGLNSVVNDVFVRADGKILASGLFTQVGNNALFVEPTAVGRIAQLDAAGDLDLEFNPGGDGANNSILDAISLPNGDLLLAGGFTSFNGVDRSRLAVVAGYNGSTLTVTSPSFFAASVGQPVQFAFAANDPTASFSLSGALPLGITFDAVLGRLIGTAQEAGQFSLQVIATTPLGNSSAPAPFLLTVNSSGPATFAAWQAAHFTSPLPPSAGPHEVLNTRGLSNLLVYALNGGDPRNVQPEVSPTVKEENYAGKNYLTLSAPKNPLALGLVYRVEISTDLVNWTYDSASVVVLSDTASEIKARAAVAVAEAGRQFIRLKVLAP